MKRTDLCTDKAKLIAVAKAIEELEAFMPNFDFLNFTLKNEADFNYKDYIKKDVDVSK